MTRKKIFISHAAADNYIVPLLDKLLELHGHEPWYAQYDLRAGDLFHEKIEEELARADILVVIVSRRTAKSTWVTTEIAKFRALKPAAQVIPLVLDDFHKAELDRISPGLSAFHAISCENCLLEGFTKLFAALGRDFLSKRILGNRRIEPDRRRGKDRRQSTMRQRLSMGLLVTYTRDTGRSVAEGTRITAADLEELRAIALYELSRYVYVDLRDRTEASAERVLSAALQHVETCLANNGTMDTIEALRGLAAYICEEYEITMAERRTSVRRRDP